MFRRRFYRGHWNFCLLWLFHDWELDNMEIFLMQLPKIGVLELRGQGSAKVRIELEVL